MINDTIHRQFETPLKNLENLRPQRKRGKLCVFKVDNDFDVVIKRQAYRFIVDIIPLNRTKPINRWIQDIELNLQQKQLDEEFETLVDFLQNNELIRFCYGFCIKHKITMTHAFIEASQQGII
ncbi:hypothetical protein [Lactococcus protaetiae]|uniref:Uncharacterized protein n=1 Tax=Lactococcus protaetiae TaxID=2592653 RepID=A0A514Z6E1_9LACT|nr:hypothetical protein [Lactococcus protaetiae]QDK70162.1 hypothetical protein FLP15_01935 [Lactococcus protaetiae]